MRCWRFIVIMLAVVLAQACAKATDYAEIPTETVKFFHDGWQYRYGDSPVADDGHFTWLDEGPAAPEWTAQPHFPEWVPSKPGPQMLWQRNVLPTITDDRQTMMLVGTWQVFEVFVGGERVFKFGDTTEAGRNHYPGRVWNWIDLKPEWSGKEIALRFYSSDHFIGLYDGVHLGTRGDHILWMFKRDMPVLIMGTLYIFLGIVMIFLFTRNRREIVNYSFGAFSISIGVYEICRTYVKHFLFYDPVLWGHVELTALFIVPTTFGLFAEHVIGAGPFKILRRVWQVNTLFLLVVHLRHLVIGASLWSAVYIFQKWLLGASFLMLLLIGRAAFVGNQEARFFFGGTAMVVLAAIHDVLASMGIIQSLGIVNHLGMFALIASLSLIVGRRYFLTAAMARNIELASAVQNLLLPSQRQGDFGPFSFSSFYQPHDRMSGDWINFWETNNGERRLIFGDVVGKGPRAALAVAAIAAFIESSKEAGDDMLRCVERIDKGLNKLFGGFVTTTLTAMVMHESGELYLFNCGGMGWLRWGKSGAEHIMMPSSVLGMGGNTRVSQRSVSLEPAEYLISFTDGVVDGSRAILRLTKALKLSKDTIFSLDDLLAVTSSMSSKMVQDDRSIVAVQRTPEDEVSVPPVAV